MPRVDYDKIASVLARELDTTALSETEVEIWLDMFVERMSEPGPDEPAFFAERRARQLDS